MQAVSVPRTGDSMGSLGSLRTPARTITFSNVPPAPTPPLSPTRDDAFDVDDGDDESDAPEVITFSKAAKIAKDSIRDTNAQALENLTSSAARRARRARRASEFSPSTLADREDRTSMGSTAHTSSPREERFRRRRATDFTLPEALLSEAHHKNNNADELENFTPREARTVTAFVREKTTEKTAGKYTIRARSGASKKTRNQHIGKKAMQFLKNAFSRNNRMGAGESIQRSTRCSNVTRTRTL